MLLRQSGSYMRFTNVTPIIRTHNILTSHKWTHKTPLEPIKNALLFWVHLQASNIWKIIMGTLLDNLPEIDAIIGDIIFLWVCWSHVLYIQWQRQHLFWGHCWRKTRAWWHQIHKQGLHINKSSWFSGLGAGPSPWSHRFNPCCIHVFFYWINNPCSSSILLNP
jgi:hypothetical protein